MFLVVVYPREGKESEKASGKQENEHEEKEEKRGTTLIANEHTTSCKWKETKSTERGSDRDGVDVNTIH